MIIGRKKELEIIKKAYQDEYSHFIAVYGRRRIGKTFLVREAFDYRFTFQHAGLSEGNLQEQLFAFSESLKEFGHEPTKTPRNWMEAFSELKELIRNSSEKKKVIFIDELSWMDTQNSDLMMALENFWNGWASARKDIVLIVCTSATSWVLSKIIHNKGGLYNRLTEQISLDNFILSECEAYVKERNIPFNREQILQYYMIFGGVPYYWTFLEKGESLTQNVDRIIFDDKAPLKEEFNYLYASIFRNPKTYIAIIEALAKKKIGMTREEIIANSGLVNSGTLSTKLEELEQCGFIRKYYAFGMKKKNAIYQLIDAFTLFYYQFMKDEPTDGSFWTNQINTPKINTWQGLSFERVCLRHIDQIKKSLGISGIHTDVNSWYAKPDKQKGIKGCQIDLLIVRKDQVINLCEMKYSISHYNLTAKDDKSIKDKISDLRLATNTKFAIFPTLITTHGLVQNSYAGNIQSVVTLDELFNEL